jgi:hypothetical protein
LGQRPKKIVVNNWREFFGAMAEEVKMEIEGEFEDESEV